MFLLQENATNIQIVQQNKSSGTHNGRPWDAPSLPSLQQKNKQIDIASLAAPTFLPSDDWHPNNLQQTRRSLLKWHDPVTSHALPSPSQEDHSEFQHIANKALCSLLNPRPQMALRCHCHPHPASSSMANTGPRLGAGKPAAALSFRASASHGCNQPSSHLSFAGITSNKVL